MHLVKRAWPRRLTPEETPSDLDPLKPLSTTRRTLQGPSQKATLNCFWAKNATLFDDDLEGLETADSRFIGIEISTSPATLSDVVDLNETFTAPCLVGGVPQLYIDHSVIDDSDSGLGLGLGLDAAISLWRCDVLADTSAPGDNYGSAPKFKPTMTPPVISRAASRKTSIPIRRPIFGHFGSDSSVDSGSKFCEDIERYGAYASDHPGIIFPRTQSPTLYDDGEDSPPFLPIPSFLQVEDPHRRVQDLSPEPTPFEYAEITGEDMASRGPVIVVSETFSESASESDSERCWQVAPLKIFQAPVLLGAPGFHVGPLGVGSWDDKKAQCVDEEHSEGISRVTHGGKDEAARSTRWRLGEGSAPLRTVSPEPPRTSALVSKEERAMPSLTSVLLASGFVLDDSARNPRGGPLPRIVQTHSPWPTNIRAANIQEPKPFPCTRTETESSGCDTIGTSGCSEEGTVLTSVASGATVDPRPCTDEQERDRKGHTRLNRREKVRGKVKRALYAFALGFGGPGSAPLVTVGAA